MLYFGLSTLGMEIRFALSYVAQGLAAVMLDWKVLFVTCRKVEV